MWLRWRPLPLPRHSDSRGFHQPTVRSRWQTTRPAQQCYSMFASAEQPVCPTGHTVYSGRLVTGYAADPDGISSAWGDYRNLHSSPSRTRFRGRSLPLPRHPESRGLHQPISRSRWQSTRPAVRRSIPCMHQVSKRFARLSVLTMLGRQL